MRYHSSFKGLKQRATGPRKGFHLRQNVKQMRMWLIVGGLILLFIVSMFVFRSKKYEKPVVTPEVLSASDTVTKIVGELTNPSATLIGVSSNNPVGTAIRTLTTGMFHLSISANLPGIDRESQFYQAWLVRPVPYNYVSAGEFVTNDLGTFVLDWSGSVDKDYSDYTNLVVTLQARNGSPDPQTHIAKGTFGK
jgi:hypothetical protein